MFSATRKVIAVVLAAAGIALWLTTGEHAGASPWRVVLLVVAAAVSLVPITRDSIAWALDHVRRPTDRARRLTALGVAIVAMGYIGLEAKLQDRDLIPKYHDEHMHMLQVRMLAHGKLWTAQHPLADFFETFHVFVKPVYASIYFPGTALMYVPSIWLHLPFWFLPLVVAGGCCAILYLIVTQICDGVAGLLAALMLLSLRYFRYLAMMVMSHSVMLLLGLLIIWTWMRWRRERKLRWAALAGALMGWAAITRPVDALCYSLPVGLAMLIEMRRDDWRKIGITLSLLVVCALPFLAVQVIQNIGVVGKPFTTPYRAYCDAYTPQMSFGFHDFDPNIRPQTNLQQRLDYYDHFTLPAAREHALVPTWKVWIASRFPVLSKDALPNRMLLILLPLGLLAIRGLPRAVFVAVLPMYIAFYWFFAYLLPWYCVVIAPAILVLVLLGARAAADVWRRTGARRSVEVFLALAIATLTISWLPEFNPAILDDPYPWQTHGPSMWFSYVVLPQQVKTPAIVLFRYKTGDIIHEEPVYNIDVVNPDDAPIIRAHDLGVQRDRELFEYYAKRQPERMVYLYDRATKQFAELGRVSDLARRLPASRSATSTSNSDHQRGPSSSGPM